MIWVTLIAKYTLIYQNFLASEIPTSFRIFLWKQILKNKTKNLNFIIAIFYEVAYIIYTNLVKNFASEQL